MAFLHPGQLKNSQYQAGISVSVISAVASGEESVFLPPFSLTRMNKAR